MKINILPIPKGPFTLDEISQETGCITYNKIENISIHNITSIEIAKKGELSFLENMKYLDFLKDCKASAIIVPNKIINKLKTNSILLGSDNAYASYAKAMLKFYPEDIILKNNLEKKNIKIIDDNTFVDDKVLIENNVHIKEGTTIKSFSTIGPNVIIGKHCYISNNVSISNAVIGDNSIINAGTIVGGDGFGYAPIKEKFIKIPQIGIVKIGDHVEIGSNCTIDKGSLKYTEIKNGVKIDNLVHIAHNVSIGNNTIIAGQTGIAGSTSIGKNVMIGGQVGIAGHLKIGDNVKIGAQAGVTKNIESNISISGTPAVKLNNYLKQAIILNKMVKNK